MLLGMDITFLKTTAHKLEETPGGHYAKKSNRSGARNYHFRDLQTMLENQKRLNFLLEMQSKVTTNCDTSSGTEYKTWVHSSKAMKRTEICPKKLFKQHM